MSDFLLNLLAKDRGAVQSIRPNIPTRFETVAADEAAMDVVEDSSFAVAGPRPERADGMMAAAGRPRSGAFAALNERPEGGPVLLEASGPSPFRMDDSQPPLPVAELEADVEPTIQTQFAERSFPPPQARETHHVVSDTTISPPELARINYFDETLVIVERDRDDQERRGLEASSDPFSSQSAVPLVASSSKNIRRAPARSSTTSSGALDPPSIAQSPRLAEPDIHVTIGRVEIRANTVSAPAPARSIRKSMTLEEYERRRGPGGRS